MFCLDLVAAYKSKIKENETLQATVKSLQTSRKSQGTGGNADDEESKDEGEEDDLQAELDRLTSSMTELMEEKKQIQSAAITERKALKQEYEEKIKKLQLSLDEQTEGISQTNQKMNEVFRWTDRHWVLCFERTRGCPTTFS